MKKKAYWGIVRENSPEEKILTLDVPRDSDKNLGCIIYYVNK
jgi:hypothetical protein